MQYVSIDVIGLRHGTAYIYMRTTRTYLVSEGRTFALRPGRALKQHVSSNKPVSSPYQMIDSVPFRPLHLSEYLVRSTTDQRALDQPSTTIPIKHNHGGGSRGINLLSPPAIVPEATVPEELFGLLAYSTTLPFSHEEESPRVSEDLKYCSVKGCYT
jgi:hypothetical protein